MPLFFFVFLFSHPLLMPSSIPLSSSPHPRRANHLGSSLSLSLPLGMASSAFEVLPALEADMEDISSIFTASFADDHILGPANSNVAPDLLRAADLEFTKRLWRTREAFNARFFKVVDRNTRSILFIFYIYIFFYFKTQEAHANFLQVKPLHFPNGTILFPLLFIRK